MDVDYEESLGPDYAGIKRAAHLMLHSELPERQVMGTPSRHAVLMGLRFDGCLGFPGGLVDPEDASVEAALAREIREELGAEVAPGREHLLSVQCNATRDLLMYFYVLTVPADQFRRIELAAPAWSDHGYETLGCMRVPCYRMSGRPLKGIVAFMRHNFVANARQQLSRGLVRAGVFSEAEMQAILRDAGIPEV